MFKVIFSNNIYNRTECSYVKTKNFNKEDNLNLYNRVNIGSKLENRYNYEKLAFTYNKELIGIYIIDPKDSS